ncbi:phosphonate C-P lyase system protein PhnH [Sinisalibacter aestuarii]|uniref:Carbon-phosphorus lyase subunit PhnH n=1 Tax=Sinisalibacter aestuarii TaxID=2949426 RepID=A0ABQ5LP33_9RHOB|nr:phosphonate C-P lyase system protein PhnH [Sinisalibacter aestuarii]GKY86533.1 carbon-phosphorus lyase subunit PhnH [Sinisalibacter aestuarii]
MLDDALTGGFDDAPVQSARAFRAALSALSRPGKIETITGGYAPDPVSPAAATLLLTLCDRETPLHLAPGHDGQAVRDWVAFHIGAPLVGPAEAMFALGRWQALMPVTGFPIGTAEYPDRSATLIVELDTLTASGARLTGPGIETAAHLSVPEVRVLRANRALFPLGLDFFFTSETRLAAVPRSTIVEES